MNLIDVAQELGTEEQCIAFLEKMRWPEGVRCLQCGAENVSKFTSKGRSRVNRKGELVRSPDRHLYQCRECDEQFSATAGTIFHDSHLPLTKWMFAVCLMVNARKGLELLMLIHPNSSC